MAQLEISGLDHLNVAQTRISAIDGTRGQLVIRGYSLDQLRHSSYENMLELLWEQPAAGLGPARRDCAEKLRPLLPWARELGAPEWLRLALDSFPSPSPEQVVAILTMALVLRRQPQAQPDPNLGMVEDVARMLRPEVEPPAWWIQGLRSYWVCVAEHGFNASTFTARVVASTGAPLSAAVSAALGALQGPLHGGAPGPVLDMLDELHNCPDPEAWIQDRVQRGERLMGFGHRLYKVRDPRAELLQQACHGLPHIQGQLAFAARMESLATAALARLKPGRRLQTNVEYYTALLLQGLGFERDEFTAVFACARVLGWVAHVYEQQRFGRLIRPCAEYVGALP